MRFAVCSDEWYPVNDAVVAFLHARGHQTQLFGALLSHQPESWVQTATQAATVISAGDCQQGIFFCWTGTGIAMAANKVRGIRAALCPDAATAVGARIWNDANVLALSNRLTSVDVAQEIVAAWLDAPPDARGQAGIAELLALEAAAYAGPR